ncbi:hypothetical protein B0A55_09651 [Friedmanniomyces simplex]|uniref:gluconokinase n=1 Tax=Friedmanniomyces simplex TaxID=329884 RepID=A0A4U0WVE3_9PEZI|nr:hypothetical protein B0A55_09651 [Friedmanniomyces simplex]
MSTEAVTHLPPTPPSEPSTYNNRTAPTSAPQSQQKHLWVITGPAGCGKTSVAEYLHQQLQLPYLEGDTVSHPYKFQWHRQQLTNLQFHTPENVQKMANGQPLTDADRWDWLILLREQALLTLTKPSSPQPPTTPTTPTASSASTLPPSGVIITCSALKRKYRDVLRIAAYHRPDLSVHFVYLQASEAVLMDRVRARQNHYMKDYMVHSQFQSLEAPQEDELRGDVLSVDAGGESKEVQRLALGMVRGVM